MLSAPQLSSDPASRPAPRHSPNFAGASWRATRSPSTLFSQLRSPKRPSGSRIAKRWQHCSWAADSVPAYKLLGEPQTCGLTGPLRPDEGGGASDHARLLAWLTNKAGLYPVYQIAGVRRQGSPVDGGRRIFQLIQAGNPNQRGRQIGVTACEAQRSLGQTPDVPFPDQRLELPRPSQIGMVVRPGAHGLH